MSHRARFLVSAIAVLAIAGIIQAQQPAPITFGTLQPANAEQAQAQARQWLEQAGKTDPATLQKFNAIWQDNDRSVSDRLADTFALGNEQVAKLLEQASNPLTPAPTELPELIKQAKDKFFQANLAVAYARELVHRRVFEEALAVLNTVRPEEVADPASYLFHRAVCEHGLLQKDNANQTINRILQDVTGSPERYKTVAVLMLLDMQTWKDKDLAEVARKMENVERRLDLARGGPQTQKIQKDIVRRLDEIIKELENKAKGGVGNGGACPNGGQPGNGGGDNPTTPMQDSQIANNGGDGNVDQAKLRKLVAEWGRLPERERARALQDLTRGLSSSHREAIENYFRNLAQTRRR